MRSSLDHLPADRQHELSDTVLAKILTAFEDAHTRSETGWKKKGRIHKVLLYGSFARGGWVYEPHTKKAYSSDYDLLVMVNRKQVVENTAFWSSLEDHFIKEQREGRLKSMPSIIVHTRSEVYNALIEGRYFLTEVVNEGAVLYDADDAPFPKPRPKTAQARLALAQEYFDEWYPMGGEFFDDYVSNLKKKRFHKAAFELHQAVEHLYHTALLVLTLYTPHNHNIKALRGMADTLDRRFAYVWPTEQRWQKAAFHALRDAYVKARYNKRGYKITEDQLIWSGEMAQELARVVLDVCQERLTTLKQDVLSTRSNSAVVANAFQTAQPLVAPSPVEPSDLP